MSKYSRILVAYDADAWNCTRKRKLINYYILELKSLSYTNNLYVIVLCFQDAYLAMTYVIPRQKNALTVIALYD